MKARKWDYALELLAQVWIWELVGSYFKLGRQDVGCLLNLQHPQQLAEICRLISWDMLSAGFVGLDSKRNSTRSRWLRVLVMVDKLVKSWRLWYELDTMFTIIYHQNGQNTMLYVKLFHYAVFIISFTKASPGHQKSSGARFGDVHPGHQCMWTRKAMERGQDPKGAGICRWFLLVGGSCISKKRTKNRSW